MDLPKDEPAWLSLIEEKVRSSSNDLEQRVELVELLKQAVTEEPYSLPIWLAYAEYVTSLYNDSRAVDPSWTEEEALLGQELFTKETVSEIWQEGYQATQFRLNDSHLLWNKWIAFELGDSPGVDQVKNLFLDRLQTPHAAWEETSQMFSTFMTKYDENAYEETMIQVTQLAKHAKQSYALREGYELKLRAASADKDAQQILLMEYLDWELVQSRKKNGNPKLCYALYERALLAFSTAVHIWEDYASVVATAISHEGSSDSTIPSLMFLLQRATKRCPWSGSLWARYLLRAELSGLPHLDIEDIKNTAVASSHLDRDGMTSVLMVYSSWCGYLRRHIMRSDASDEDMKIADREIPNAVKQTQQWGERLYGKKEFKGDPKFTLERCFIDYQTLKGETGEARGIWEKLIKTHGDSYEFWQQYYEWEISVEHTDLLRPLATAVLQKAVNRRGLDWPEKILEMYLNHCTSYQDAEGLAKAVDIIHRNYKGVVKRRQKEAVEMASAYAAQQPLEVESAGDVRMVGTEEPAGSAKRKRESPVNEENGASKKAKPDNSSAGPAPVLKRDRENTTVLITNLAPDITQTKVKQYFREYGHINNLSLKAESDGLSASALIEFRSADDVQSALLKNEKYFGDKQIQVVEGTGLTLYVTNYPPTADDSFMHNLFKDCGEILSIRWPSLKYNTHRRFCYISFKSSEATAKATSQLDGKLLEGKYKLEVKYSDPGKKKPREGAMAEGREIHIGGLDREATEDQLREVFTKYGGLESIRILRNMAGKSKGAAFVVYTNADEAKSSLELDKTKFMSQILSVELATGTNYKPKATTSTSSETSTSVDPAILTRRTITLRNIPDTVNDARIKALAEKYGKVSKLVLRPDISGANIEYAEETSAGKATLALDGMEFEGRALKVDEGRALKSNGITIAGPPKLMQQSSAPIRRPGAAGRGTLGGAKRGRGGLGLIR